jgi:hypothetical protein
MLIPVRSEDFELHDVARFYYNQTYGILQCRTQGGLEVTRLE